MEGQNFHSVRNKGSQILPTNKVEFLRVYQQSSRVDNMSFPGSKDKVKVTSLKC